MRRFRPGGLLRDDGRTQVRVIEIQSLNCWDLPDDPKIVHFPRAPSSPTIWHFAMVQVTSHKLGTYVRPLLYATVENNIFYHEVVRAWDVQLTHILRVGYGGGFGGGCDRGDWLENALEPRGAELFVADHGLLPPAALANRRLVAYRHVEPLGWGPKTGVFWDRVS